VIWFVVVVEVIFQEVFSYSSKGARKEVVLCLEFCTTSFRYLMDIVISEKPKMLRIPERVASNRSIEVFLLPAIMWCCSGKI